MIVKVVKDKLFFFVSLKLNSYKRSIKKVQIDKIWYLILLYYWIIWNVYKKGFIFTVKKKKSKIKY